MGVSHLPVHHRNARQTARLQQIVIGSVICLAIYCFLLVPEKSLDSPRSTNPEAYQSRPQRQKESEEQNHRTLSPELLNNRFLTEDQCRSNFPGLLDQVDDEVAKGPFKLERSKSSLGPTILRIRDGQLYILSAARKSDLSRDMLAHRSATLHQIANALLTWPRSSSPSSSSSSYPDIPNTILFFNHHDDPLSHTLSYSRPVDPALLETKSGSVKRFFPIPHFSFYSWPLPFIGSLPRAARAITEIEASLPFAAKIPRAVWRGTTWFNNARAGRVRQNLVRAFGTAAGRPGMSVTAPKWADIETLEWSTPSQANKGGENAKKEEEEEEEDAKRAVRGGDNNGLGERNATNALPIEDFCRYKYIIHTEGVTYSGRFQFHNLCGSVVLSPPIAWMQHVTHLLKPAFSYALDPDAADTLDIPQTHLSSSSSSSSSSSYDSSSSSSPPHRRLTLRTLFSFSLKSQHQAPTPPKAPKGLPRHPIPLDSQSQPKSPASLLPYPSPWVNHAWPISYPPSTVANIIFVAPDWSDLEATIAWLESHPKIASSIARRQRELFSDSGGGYLSIAAETCYWRGLIRGWGKTARWDEKDFEDLGQGMAWEEFSLREVHK
ncbi:hypothetical protein F4808DRAFT_6514 [Astrocystis sublimbata]|nr:hypothetical protein F4808DRAFT_6514 [Astrocystis sublimbata]